MYVCALYRKIVHAHVQQSKIRPDGKELKYFSCQEPAFKALQKLVLAKVNENSGMIMYYGTAF